MRNFTEIRQKYTEFQYFEPRGKRQAKNKRFDFVPVPFWINIQLTEWETELANLARLLDVSFFKYFRKLFSLFPQKVTGGWSRRTPTMPTRLKLSGFRVFCVTGVSFFKLVLMCFVLHKHTQLLVVFLGSVMYFICVGHYRQQLNLKSLPKMVVAFFKQLTSFFLRATILDHFGVPIRLEILYPYLIYRASLWKS